MGHLLALLLEIKVLNAVNFAVAESIGQLLALRPTLMMKRAGEAEAKKDSTIAEAKADEQRMEAKLSNDTEIARWEFSTVFSNSNLAMLIRAKRDYELKKAQYDTEVILITPAHHKY